MGRLHSIFCIFSGSVAFSLNALLTYIIFITRGSSVGKYKHLLCLYTLSAAIYASNQIVTAGEFAICSEGYVFYDTLQILPYSIALIFIENYTVCFLEMIAIISWCFIYRYFVSLRANNLDALHRHGKFLFLATVCTLAFMLSCSLYSTFPREEYYQELGADFLNISGRELRETANNCGPLTVGGQTNSRLFWGLGQFVIFILICAIINIFCAVRIALFLRKCFAESRTAMKRQTRIFILLMLQFIFPLCLNLTPVFLVLIVPYLKINSYGLEYYVGAVSSIAQIIDPLLIFIFIHDYRVTLRNLLTKGKWRPSKTTDYSATNHPSETTRRHLQKGESTENIG